MNFDKDFEVINNAIREDSRRAFRRAFKQLCDTAPNELKFTLVNISKCEVSPYTHIGKTKYYTISNGRIYPQAYKSAENHSHGYEIEDFIFRVWNCYIIGNTFYHSHLDGYEIGDKYFKNKYIVD